MDSITCQWASEYTAHVQVEHVVVLLEPVAVQLVADVVVDALTLQLDVVLEVLEVAAVQADVAVVVAEDVEAAVDVVVVVVVVRMAAWVSFALR